MEYNVQDIPIIHPDDQFLPSDHQYSFRRSSLETFPHISHINKALVSACLDEGIIASPSNKTFDYIWCKKGFAKLFTTGLYET